MGKAQTISEQEERTLRLYAGMLGTVWIIAGFLILFAADPGDVTEGIFGYAMVVSGVLIVWTALSFGM